MCESDGCGMLRRGQGNVFQGMLRLSLAERPVQREANGCLQAGEPEHAIIFSNSLQVLQVWEHRQGRQFVGPAVNLCRESG